MRLVRPAAVAAAFVYSVVAFTAPPSSSQETPPPLGLTLKPAPGGVERAEIVAVASGSAAEAAGLKTGDVLLYATADGERVSLGTQDALTQWMASQTAGSSQPISYLRGEKILTANVAIAAAPSGAGSAPTASASARLLGLTVKPTADGSSVTITDIKPGSAAGAAGLQVGDVLMSGQTGAANADSLVSQDALDSFAAKSAGTTRDVIYTRNKQFLTAKIAVPADAPTTTNAPQQTAAAGTPPIGLGISVKEDIFALALQAVGHITAIVPGSDAEIAGLKVGDSIRSVTFGNVSFGSIASQTVADALAYSAPPGTVAQFTIKRDGREILIPVKMTGPVASAAFAGMEVKDTSADAYAVDVTSVQPGSPADAAGIQAGDRIKAPSYTFYGSHGLNGLLVQMRGDWFTVNIMRNGQKISTRLTVPKEPLLVPANMMTAQAAAPAPNPVVAAATGLAGPAAPVSLPAGNDPFAQTVTTLNGRNTQLPTIKLRKGQILEAQVSANGAPLMPKLCFEEDDAFNVDPERCHQNITMSGHATVRFRHVAVEDEIVTVSVASTDASAGTYTITTRDGVRAGEGPAALAVLEGLAGHPYIVDYVDQGLPVKAAVRYLVDEAGKRGRLRYQIETGTTFDIIYALDNNRQLTWASPTNKGEVYLGIDGLLYQQAGDQVSVRGRSASGEILWATERRLQTGDNKDAMHIGVFGRSLRLGSYAPATEEQVVALMLDAPAHIAQAQQQRAEDWAALGQMAGRFFYFINGQYEYVASFQWEVPGEVMVARHWAADEIGTAPNPLRRMTYDPAARAIATDIIYPNGATARSTFKRGANGESIETQADGGSWTLSGAGNEWTSVYADAKRQETKISYRPMDDNTLKIFADRSQAKQARLAQERAQAAAQQEADSGIGLFDILNFAQTVQGAMSSPQAYAAAVAQAAPELAPILNGVAAAQSGANPLAAATGLGGGVGGGNPLAAMAGGGINPYTGLGGGRGLGGLGGLGGTGGGPTGVRGTYPTRPNLAEGPQCPGFTISNYRTHAFEGGRDQQLFALCGQAFEYYKWYLNAIDQGYSEADANRTYNAHEGAVRNLKSM